MALGLVCQVIEAKKKKNGSVEYHNLMEEKSLQLGRYNNKLYPDSQIVETYVNNVRNLARMVPTINKHAKCFRMSSSLIPLGDRVDRSLWDNSEVRQHLAAAGNAFREHGIRVTMHPGQFCVLSSNSESVIKNAISDLSIHAWILDAMGMPQTPEAAINIHGGKSNESKKLIDVIRGLPHNIKNRLTLENDESCYSVLQLLEIHNKTNVPVVLDSHHHSFNEDHLSLKEAYDAACSTWPSSIRPLQHLSNSETGTSNASFMIRRKHSNYIHSIPDPQLEGLLDNKIDVEIEAKMKNLAIANIRKDFNIFC